MDILWTKKEPMTWELGICANYQQRGQIKIWSRDYRFERAFYGTP